MATTANNGWTIPADTDLVRNGASAMRTLGNGIDNTIGAWKTTWTPAVQGTGWTKGTGTTTGRYKQISDVVFFEMQFVVGNGTKSANPVNFNLPVTNDGTMDQWVTGVYFVNSTSEYYSIVAKITGGNVYPYVTYYNTGGLVTVQPVINTKPVTVASGDVIQISGTYRS